MNIVRLKCWIDHQPGPNNNPTMYAEADVEFPTTGYSVELQKHEPQDEGQDNLVLDLLVDEPGSGDATGSAVTTETARYQEHADVRYKDVTLVARFRCSVEEVH